MLKYILERWVDYSSLSSCFLIEWPCRDDNLRCLFFSISASSVRSSYFACSSFIISSFSFKLLSFSLICCFNCSISFSSFCFNITYSKNHKDCIIRILWYREPLKDKVILYVHKLVNKTVKLRYYLFRWCSFLSSNCFFVSCNLFVCHLSTISFR